MEKLLLAVFYIAVCASEAEAYLDPASGNALVSFLIAILGSAAYIFKSIFYKSFSGSKAASSKQQFAGKKLSPILFSEGKTYWTTFKPIVDELIRRKVHFRYITMDIQDPGLEIDSEFMDSKRLSNSSLGFSKVTKLQSPIMLSTTPNIGTEGYPMKRPFGVEKLVHVFHSLVDVSCYYKGSLDAYDAVLMAGPQQEEPIRTVEQARNLPPKELINAGLPCLDDLYRQMKENESTTTLKKQEATILVAPSWGEKGCLSLYGTNFINELAEAGYNIVVRPHPQSYIHEPDLLQQWQDETERDCITWDTETFGTTAMSQADLLISDTSSIRFDFSFLYMKPVITLQIPKENRSSYESDYMQKTWADTVSTEIGAVLTHQTVKDIVSVVEKSLDSTSEEMMRTLRKRYVSNFGNSASPIVDYLVRETEELQLTPLERSLKEGLEKLKVEVELLKESYRDIHLSPQYKK
jgi:hypothetical protein